MSLRLRRFLYISFIFIFLVVTPLVSFYAAGYRVTVGDILSGNFRIQRTGMLVLNSEPKGAKIFINDKPQNYFFKKYYAREKSNVVTPAKLKNIMPGEHRIKIELPGYWPWEKKLTIYPGGATYAENIYLFRNDLPIFITGGEVKNIIPSPDLRYLLFVSDKNASMFDTDTEKTKIIIEYNDSAPATSTVGNPTPDTTAILDDAEAVTKLTVPPFWSNDGKRLLIRNMIVTADNSAAPLDLSRTISPDIARIKWDLSRGHIIYYVRSGNLNEYNLNTGLSRTITHGRAFADYLIKDKRIYLVSQIGQTTNLDIYSEDNNALLGSFNLPHSSEYTFMHTGHKLLNLYDSVHQILYLIDPTLGLNPLREIINNAGQSQWITEDKLLYASGFEAWIYDAGANKKTLLNRISRKITGLFWHPSDNYVILTTDETVHVIELDEREKRNITEILKLKVIKWPILNKDGNTLYFYSKLGKQEGLYKLAIQ